MTLGKSLGLPAPGFMSVKLREHPAMAKHTVISQKRVSVGSGHHALRTIEMASMQLAKAGMCIWRDGVVPSTEPGGHLG